MSSPEADTPGIIRPYRASDHDELFRIAADTAFFGEPVERYMEDRRIFNEFFYAYYTDVEPAYAWIAEVDGKVAGFLAGCLNTRARAGRYTWYVVPRLAVSTLRGCYRFGPLTRNYLRRWAGAAFRREIPYVDTKIYPAHLHTNVDVRYRGRGLGRRLMSAYLGQLRDLAVPGVHLDTTNLNQAACRLYASFGFQVVDSRLTRMWAGLVEGPVENRCYGLLLTQARLGRP